MALEEYRKKRDFRETPEPAGKPGADKRARSAEPPESAGPGRGRLYVIQKHAATRLHYDFRLELDGVLLSWAVPKGPSLDPHDRHLAVRVEDHPVEYGTFEGIIPKGEYGAGTVELWDRGTWEPVGDPHDGLARGDLKFTLRGEKLRGGWVLARMRGRSAEEGKENWLLIKHRDEFAIDGDGQALLADQGRSVASGRTLEEIAAEADASVWHGDEPANAQSEARAGEEFGLDASRLPGAKKVDRLPRFVPPELATLVKEAPEGDGWLHEIKLDGYRAMTRVESGKAEMYSRNDKDWTGFYQPLAKALAALPVRNALLDGEVVVQLPDGTTSFQTLQNDLGSGRTDRLLYYAFDLLFLDGYDLTSAPIEERKKLLARLIARASSDGKIRFIEALTGQGPAFRKQACSYGLEGIVSKRAGSVYRPGVRGNEWLKSKCFHQQEFVIGGYTDPASTRVGFGALLVGAYEQGTLRYVGKVGTGYSEKVLRDLGARLRSIEVEAPAFAEGVERAPKGSHWVRPELVAEVAFVEWTNDGDIRHPSFKGLREDVRAGDVIEEKGSDPRVAAAQAPTSARHDRHSAVRADSRGAAPGAAAAPAGAGSSQAGTAPAADGAVKISHPDRIFWSAEDITKQDLVNYYQRVAKRMLPYVLHRPVSMVRCPEGVEGEGPEFHEHQPGPCFFHKHAGPDFRGPFERLQIRESGGVQSYLAISEAASLTALAQMGVLEIHIWGSRSPDVEHPDMLVFDLDPDPSVGWPGVVEGARLLRGLMQGLGLETFVKTTGGKGLHVVAPVTPSQDWEGVRKFTKAVADAIVDFAPDKYTSQMSKSKRKGKTFVDYVPQHPGRDVDRSVLHEGQGACDDIPSPCGGRNWAARSARIAIRSRTCRPGCRGSRAIPGTTTSWYSACRQ